jgi:hypothetical protein
MNSLIAKIFARMGEASDDLILLRSFAPRYEEAARCARELRLRSLNSNTSAESRYEPALVGHKGKVAGL